jgi:hypothetical protein
MAPQLAGIGLGNMGRVSSNLALSFRSANQFKGMWKNIVEKGELDKPLLIFNPKEKRAVDLRMTLYLLAHPPSQSLSMKLFLDQISYLPALLVVMKRSMKPSTQL